MRKLFICFIAFLFFVQLGAGNVSALTKTSGDLELAYDTDPLFSSSIIWYPGLSVTKQFTVKNLGGSMHTVSVQATNESQTGNLADMLTVGLGAFSGTMKNFWDSGQINLSDLSAGNSQTYDMTVGFDSTAGNDFQNKTVGFDLIIGFAGTGDQVAIGGFGGGGGPSGPAACNDSQPGLPSNFTAIVGPDVGQVNLSWTPPPVPYTYFLVAYSDSPTWPPKWGNPDVGNVTNFQVSGLGGGTYWFWLRAGNGCTPGDFVGPVSPGVVAGAGTAVATGFVSGVLGVETKEEITPEIMNLGEVAGASTKPVCWWWLILLLTELGTLGIYYRLLSRRKISLRYWWFPAIALAVLAFVGDQFVAHRFFTPSRFCSVMWLWVILAAGLPTAIFYKTIKRN